MRASQVHTERNTYINPTIIATYRHSITIVGFSWASLNNYSMK